MKCTKVLIIDFLIAAALLTYAFTMNPPITPDRYRPGDWISFGVTNYISSVAVGTDEAYFGTTAGILRYDILRDHWKSPYSTSDGLAGNSITTVGYDPFTGFLWCTSEYGISRQHPASLRWTNFSKSEIGISPHDEIVSIGFDAQYNWFETRTRQIFRQDKYSSFFSPSDLSSLRARPDLKWFGWRANPSEPLPHFFMPAGYLFDPSSRAAAPHPNFQTLAHVQDDRLRRASVTSAIDDNWGNMWLGTWGLGALKADLNIDRARLLNFGLANQKVDALLFDDDGLWIGGLNTSFTAPFDESIQGITYWANPDPEYVSNSDWTYYDKRYNLDISSDEVNNFAFYDGKLYCATEYGINIYDKKKNRWRRIVPTDGLVDEHVNDVLIFDDYLFAATDLGLNRISLESIGSDSLRIVEIIPDELRHIRIFDLEQQQNILWAGTEQGPFIYNMATGEGGYLADNEGPRDEVTYSISFSDSVVWIGTDYGIEAFDILNREWFGAPARNRFTHTQVNCVKAGAEAVWVGTHHGVYKFHRERQEWRQYTIEDGLIDNHVNTILLDGDLIWFGADLGLTVFRWRAFHNID